MAVSAFLNFAHPIASSNLSENNSTTFSKAPDMGVVHVEGDVHRPFDDNVVVIHDGNVYRTTDGAGSMLNHTLTEIETLDACGIVLG